MKSPTIRLILSCIVLSIFAGCTTVRNDSTLRVRLQWIPQSQFAGYIVALENGYYKDQGLSVELLPAGPDLKPHVTVANGSDDIGIGVPNQVLLARSNDVPLVAIAQIFQDSPNRYVIKSENKIDSLEQLRGEKVGLWLGGDEAEFVSMLSKAGMTLEDVQVIPQKYSVVPFLEDEYILSQVTVYNELMLVQAEGFNGDKLQVLSPSEFESAILGDMIFTHESLVTERSDELQKFVDASIKGWRYAIEHPEETLEIVMNYNPDLDKEQQRKQLSAVSELIKIGGLDNIGHIDESAYSQIQDVLVTSGQITSEIDLAEAMDQSFVKAPK